MILNFLLFLIQKSLSLCETSHYFTECDTNNTRSAIFYQEDCNSTALSPIHNLPCNKVCEAGYKLDIINQTLACSPCPAGSYSTGGGIRYGEDGSDWNSSYRYLKRNCWVLMGLDWVKGDRCSSWHTENGILVSGKPDVANFFEDELVLSARLVTNGVLTYKYRKITQKANGFINGDWFVYLNGEQIQSNSHLGENSWVVKNFTIPAGSHEIAFAYQAFFQHLTDDFHAEISFIELTGLEYASTSCEKCLKGSSSEGSSACNICDFNTYWNGASCEDCPPDKYSLKGSVGINSCLERQPCGFEDITSNYTECENGKRTKKYYWKQPILCNYMAASLPSEIDGLLCEDCPIGYHQQAISNNSNITKCYPCKLGFYMTQNLTCEECGIGEISNSILLIERWETLPDGFKTKCINSAGEGCLTSSGWIANETYITTGTSLDNLSEVSLSKFINITNLTGKIEFFYVSLDMQGLFNFYINGILKSSNQVSGRYKESYDLLPGGNELEWRYRTSKDGGEIRIYDMTIEGSDEGASVECSKCPDGFISVSSHTSCIACPAGFSSNSDNSECMKCDRDYYSYSSGQACQKCPANSYSNTNNTACLGNDYLILPTKSFYLRNLTGISNIEQTYTDGLCSRDSLKLYCYQTFYGPIPGNQSELYISVLNPSVLSLPDYEYYYQTSLGYAFTLVTLDSPQTKNNSVNTCYKENTAIFNAGRNIENITETAYGFDVQYSQGDICNENGDRFSVFIEFVCNKREGGGWPMLVSRGECSWNFRWKSRWGCKICSEEEMIVVKTMCMNGKRMIEKMEGKNCIIPSDYQVETSGEDCSLSKEILYTLPVLIGLGTIILLLMAIGLLTYYCYRFKSRYQRLIDAREL
ncbi:unnamed protein product [Blepharisma stoltei]|uniref:MRH domain-containing protein n=1 Tax=Blepharisma stoltei TaxID=1481888 RepID=A0AAU9JYM0_9CILI|nr:unnamed protein product [Blepharisma stoltei]